MIIWYFKYSRRQHQQGQGTEHWTAVLTGFSHDSWWWWCWLDDSGGGGDVIMLTQCHIVLHVPMCCNVLQCNVLMCCNDSALAHGSYCWLSLSTVMLPNCYRYLLPVRITWPCSLDSMPNAQWSPFPLFLIPHSSSHHLISLDLDFDSSVISHESYQ